MFLSQTEHFPYSLGTIKMLQTFLKSVGIKKAGGRDIYLMKSTASSLVVENLGFQVRDWILTLAFPSTELGTLPKVT